MPDRLPEGWHSITPRLVVDDREKLLDFLRRAFEATVEIAGDAPAIVRIGDSKLMVSGAGIREPVRSFLHVYVADADATYRRALEAGAASVEEPSDMPYGDRRAMVTDPCGNDWQIATYRETTRG